MFEYHELAERDKLNLDLLWLRDSALEDGENLPEPEVLAAEIVEDLQAALEAFRAIGQELESAGTATTTTQSVKSNVRGKPSAKPICS